MKTENLIVRVSKEEKEKIKQIAEKHHLSVSEYVRALVFENSELAKAVAKEARHQMDVYLHLINREHNNTKQGEGEA